MTASVEERLATAKAFIEKDIANNKVRYENMLLQNVQYSQIKKDPSLSS